MPPVVVLSPGLAAQLQEGNRRLRRTPRSGKAQGPPARQVPHPHVASLQVTNTTANTTHYYQCQAVRWDPSTNTYVKPFGASQESVWLKFSDVPGSLAVNDVYSGCVPTAEHPTDGKPVFHHEGDEGISAGGGTTITVEEQDGSPSYTSIDTVQVNQADGFVLTNPSAGKALISINDASLTSPGIVSTGAQEFNGTKTFDDGLVSDNRFTITGGWDITFNPTTGNGLCRISNAGSTNGYLEMKALDSAAANSLSLAVDFGSNRVVVTEQGSGSQPKYAIEDTSTTYNGIHATVALAKLTAGGADGSLTVRGGIITAYTAPT